MSDLATSTDDAAEHRLPRTVLPHRYELTLEPDLASSTFRGRCSTELEIVEPTNRIVCNAAELEVVEAWLEDDDGARIEVELITADEETERLTLELAAVPEGNRWHLHTRFNGTLNDKLRGFYRSTYTDVDGEEQVIATTQFEATDARRAFPCWDEPDLKASFAVTLVVDEDLLALSNAAEVAREPVGGGRVAVRFAETMRMSTYLVAFIVGPLEITEAVTTAGGVPLRVAHPKGKGHLTGYALEVGRFCLDFFADYYGIPYPADKLDLVAVPDFAFGAMENLGCVTFREVLLLVDPEQVTQPELQNVTDVIAHELAHMWFGDLVTMSWWNGIWLNEAFATFMEMLATDAFRPEWDRWTSFGLSRSAAFDVDALRSTRPIEFPVLSPADAEGMFDILTYEKGAAVLRMLEQYLGPDGFKEGIRTYLARHAHGNTDTNHLFDALEEATGEPVRRIADSWIFQGGFPLITVDLWHDGHTLRFEQAHFRYAGDLGEGDLQAAAAQDAQQWAVPLIFTQSGGGVTTFEKVLLEGDQHDVEVIEPVQWVVANTEGTGFYRVAYAQPLLDGLLERAQDELSPIERYGLVDDSWAAVLADRRRAVDHLDLVTRLGDEVDLSVWQRIIGTLTSLEHLLDDAGARQVLQAEVAALVRPTLDRLGDAPADGEGDRTRQLRGVLFSALGGLAADPAARLRARELHDRATAEPGSVDPAMAAAAVAVIAASGGAAEFDEFLSRSRTADTPQEQLRYLGALADFDDVDLVDRLAAMAVTDEVRTQDAPYLLRRALHNRDHGAHVWFFVQAEWERINERFPSNSIARMLEGVRSLSRPEAAQAVFAFFETHVVPQGDKLVAQHLERLEVNVALRAREADALASHLLHER